MLGKLLWYTDSMQTETMRGSLLGQSVLRAFEEVRPYAKACDSGFSIGSCPNKAHLCGGLVCRFVCSGIMRHNGMIFRSIIADSRSIIGRGQPVHVYYGTCTYRPTVR